MECVGTDFISSLGIWGSDGWFFFFNDTATTEIYTLSLPDALPISSRRVPTARCPPTCLRSSRPGVRADRKSTRLNSSHGSISYAVFCLKKKKANDVGGREREACPTDAPRTPPQPWL